MMPKPFRLLPLLLISLIAGARLPAREVKRIPPPEGVLPVVIVESLSQPGNAYTDFDRLDVALQRVAKERKWPWKIASDRLAGGVPDYQTELNITLQGVQAEPVGQFRFRSWVTLFHQGKEHDFGIVTVVRDRRLGQNFDDFLDQIFRDAANAIAAKVEPVLFPELNAPKKTGALRPAAAGRPVAMLPSGESPCRRPARGSTMMPSLPPFAFRFPPF